MPQKTMPPKQRLQLPPPSFLSRFKNAFERRVALVVFLVGAELSNDPADILTHAKHTAGAVWSDPESLDAWELLDMKRMCILIILYPDHAKAFAETMIEGRATV